MPIFINAKSMNDPNMHNIPNENIKFIFNVWYCDYHKYYLNQSLVVIFYN